MQALEKHAFQPQQVQCSPEGGTLFSNSKKGVMLFLFIHPGNIYSASAVCQLLRQVLQIEQEMEKIQMQQQQAMLRRSWKYVINRSPSSRRESNLS